MDNNHVITQWAHFPIENHRNTVLLIDDEEVIRELGTEMLDSIGLSCITAETGEQGVAVYRKHAATVLFVLLDIQLPGICGNIVYDRLLEINPFVPVLFASGHNKGYVESFYFKHTLDHFIAKPFRIDDLKEKINRLLSGGPHLSTPQRSS